MLEFPFHFETINDHTSLVTKPITPSSKKRTAQAPKVKLPHLEIDTRKRKKTSSTSPKQSSQKLSPSTSLLHPSSVPLEPIKSLPLTVFDFNGSSESYEHVLPFIDTNALHLICIHTADFHQTAPTDMKEVFNKTLDSTVNPMITELFQILQLLCEKVTEKHGIMILPIATYIDLYDKRPNEDK